MNETFRIKGITLNILILFLLILNFCVQAKPSARIKFYVERAENIKKRETLVLPYVFSTDDLGTVFGVGAMATGLYQKQMTLGGTVFGGVETKGAFLALWDYSLFDTQRFFLVHLVWLVNTHCYEPTHLCQVKLL